VKTRTAIDLLGAVDAVLEGRHFVSFGFVDSELQLTPAKPGLPAML
jgi:hypothetical protein